MLTISNNSPLYSACVYLAMALESGETNAFVFFSCSDGNNPGLEAQGFLSRVTPGEQSLGSWLRPLPSAPGFSSCST